MGAGVCALLLVCLACGLAESGGRTRRDVHRIIIREQVARGRGPQHQHSRGPARGHREQTDGRHRGLHDNHEYSDEYERRPAESSKKYKKPLSSESQEEAFASDWKPVISSKNNYYYPPPSPSNKISTIAPIAKEKTGPTNNVRIKTTLKPLPIHEAIDITTVSPPKKVTLSPSVYKNNLKRINHMNYFNYKLTQRGANANAPVELKQKEDYDLPRRRPVKKQVQAKKVDGGYQVHEDVEDDTKPPKYTSFNALSPSLMKSVPLYPAFEDNQIVDRPRGNKTESFGKRLKARGGNKSSRQ